MEAKQYITWLLIFWWWWCAAIYGSVAGCASQQRAVKGNFDSGRGAKCTKPIKSNVGKVSVTQWLRCSAIVSIWTNKRAANLNKLSEVQRRYSCLYQNKRHLSNKSRLDIETVGWKQSHHFLMNYKYWGGFWQAGWVLGGIWGIHMFCGGESAAIHLLTGKTPTGHAPQRALCYGNLSCDPKTALLHQAEHSDRQSGRFDSEPCPTLRFGPNTATGNLLYLGKRQASALPHGDERQEVMGTSRSGRMETFRRLHLWWQWASVYSENGRKMKCTNNSHIHLYSIVHTDGKVDTNDATNHGIRAQTWMSPCSRSTKNQWITDYIHTVIRWGTKAVKHYCISHISKEHADVTTKK